MARLLRRAASPPTPGSSHYAALDARSLAVASPCPHAQTLPMRDLTHPGWIKAKGLLFLFLGLLSSAFLLFDRPTLKFAFLLVVAIWSFCRFYYFAFYVLERYIAPRYRFSGLVSFAAYLISKKDPAGKPFVKQMSAENLGECPGCFNLGRRL